MKLIRLISYLTIFIHSVAAYAETVDFYLEGSPANYRVWTWDQGQKTIVYQGATTKNFDVFKFSIPSEHVVKDNEGEIDVKASLVKWRKSTSTALGNPKTLNDVGYYPFTDEHGSTHYVALEHIQENSTKYPNINLNFSGAPTASESVILDASEAEPKSSIAVNSTDEVAPNSPEDLARRQAILDRATKARRNPNPSLEVLEENPNKEEARPPAKKLTTGAQNLLKELQKIKSNPASLQCASNNGNSAHCMVCNCYYESRGEAYSGMVAVNRTVMTRVVRQNFPGSICGVVWYQKRGVAAFSWTLESGKSRRRSSSSVRTCVNATADAVKLGTWQWDHFYNPRRAAPSWAPAMQRRNGSKTYGNHKFLNSGSGLKKTSRKSGSTYSKTTAQRGTQ